MTDKELIQKFQQGSEKSFNELVLRHQDWVRGFIQKSVRNREDSEDLAQEVFVKTYFGLGSFRFESEFTTWLYRVVINQINNFYRKQKMFSWFYRDIQEAHTQTTTEPTDDRSSKLMMSVGKLPKMQRSVMILRTFQDLPFKDIGSVLSITENSAKVNYHKAKKNLRKYLDDK